jgi:hypothetical protein
MTIILSSSYTVIECCNCHIHFAVPNEFNTDKHDDHTSFYCPQGHKQWYTQKSREEKLEEQVASCRDDANFWEKAHDGRLEEVTEVKLSNRALKGHLTRLRGPNGTD